MAGAGRKTSARGLLASNHAQTCCLTLGGRACCFQASRLPGCLLSDSSWQLHCWLSEDTTPVSSSFAHQSLPVPQATADAPSQHNLPHPISPTLVSPFEAPTPSDSTVDSFTLARHSPSHLLRPKRHPQTPIPIPQAILLHWLRLCILHTDTRNSAEVSSVCSNSPSVPATLSRRGRQWKSPQ